MPMDQKETRFKASVLASGMLICSWPWTTLTFPWRGGKWKENFPTRSIKASCYRYGQSSQAGKETQADRHLPARKANTHKQVDSLSSWFISNHNNKDQRRAGGVFSPPSIYISDIQVDVLQTAYCLSLFPRWFVWAINRPPLLWPSTESICLYPFIYQPACPAACLPVSVSVCLTVFPCSLSRSCSQNTVHLYPSVIWILDRQAEQQL